MSPARYEKATLWLMIRTPRAFWVRPCVPIRGRGPRREKERVPPRHGNTLNSTFAIMRVGGYVNARGTLITHTHRVPPYRGCSRKSSLFFRQGITNDFEDSGVVRVSQLKRETSHESGKAPRVCSTRFTNTSAECSKIFRRNRLP